MTAEKFDGQEVEVVVTATFRYKLKQSDYLTAKNLAEAMNIDETNFFEGNPLSILALEDIVRGDSIEWSFNWKKVDGGA